MRTVALVALLVCAAAALASAEAVVKLDGSSFDSVVDGSKHVLVEFFAPWCGHCKNLAPEYEAAAEALIKHKDTVVVASVDCDEHKDLCSKYDVKGFPTLKFFRKGEDVTKPEDYSGGRTADTIVEYLNKNAGVSGRIKKAPSAVRKLTDDNFDEIVLDETKDVLVAFTAPWCGHCKSLHPVYEKLANAFAGEKNVVIANIDADAYKVQAGKYDVSGFPTIKFFPKGGKPVETYSSGRDLASFVTFLNEKAGTKRNADGSLSAEAGIIASLDAQAKEFIGASAARRGEIIAAFKAYTPADEAETFSQKIYVHTAGKLASDVQFVGAEVARLQRIIESGSVAPSKIDEFSSRINIIKSFTTASA